MMAYQFCWYNQVIYEFWIHFCRWLWMSIEVQRHLLAIKNVSCNILSFRGRISLSVDVVIVVCSSWVHHWIVSIFFNPEFASTSKKTVHLIVLMSNGIISFDFLKCLISSYWQLNYVWRFCRFMNDLALLSICWLIHIEQKWISTI